MKFESVIIIVLLVVIGVMMYNYRKSDVNFDSENVIIDTKDTALAVAKAVTGTEQALPSPIY